MKLLTKKLEAKIPALYSFDEEATVQDDGTITPPRTFVCKFFNPMGAGTWYVMEGEKQEDGDWRFYGYVELLEKEWGYFMLSDLESVNYHGLGVGIERDIHFENELVEKYTEEN